MENALINCRTAGTLSSCSSVDGRIGRYYLNSGEDKSTKKLIECSSNGCVPITNKEGYFLDGEGDNSKIIQCKTEASFTCGRINHNGTNNSPKYYVNNSNDKKLIACTDDGCKISDVVVKGYFLNGSSSSGKTLIECNGTDCSEKDDTSFASLNAVGNLMVSTDGVRICVATGCSGEGVVKVGYSSSDTYKTIHVEANDDFITGTLVTGNPYTIKIGKDGSVILLEEMGAFGTCGTSGKYCFDSDNKIKYGSSSDIITSEEAGTKIYYFNPKTNQMVDNIPSIGTIPDVIAYKCTFILTDDEDANDNKVVALDTCHWIRGFVIDGTHTIQCSGWKHEGCTISSSLKSCEDGDEGRLGSGKKICFGKAMIDIPKAGAEDTGVVFLSNEININYGKAASSIVSLSITSNSALVSDSLIIDTKYVIKVGDEFKLYNYDADGSPEKYTLDETTTIISTLEIIRGYTYESNDFVADTSVLFNCYQGSCVRSKGFVKNAADSKLYSSDVINISNDPDWKEVSSEDQACTTNEHIGHVTGTVTLCVPDRTANANPPVKTVTVSSSVYFLGSETTYKLYNSIDDTIGIVDPSDGYYLVNASDKLEASTGEGSLYLCSKKVCEKKGTPDIGYYINAGSQKMIACAEETVNEEKVTKCKLKSDEGYYINTNKELIHCANDNKCKLSDEVGYFVNGNTADTENPIIQCGSKGCEAIAVPAAGSISCNSDAQIGKLNSDKKVCLNNSSLVTDAITDTSVSFIINYSTGSVFKNYINKNTYFGLVTVVQNKKITLNFDNAKSVYCLTKNNMKIVADADCTEAALASTHEKYVCNVDGVCLPQTETTETLPESIRGQKNTDDSEEEEENTSASDLKIECDVLTGKNCNLNTYYLVNKSRNYAVIEDTGSLFYCTTENTPCQEIRNIGYYIVNENYIYTCKEYDTEVECSREDIPSQESITTCSAVGKLYKNSNKLYMCVFTNTSLELNTISSNGNYVIEKDTDNVFGLSSTETHAIVNIQDKRITLNVFFYINIDNNKLGYVYSNLKKNAQVLEKGSSSCPTKGSGATLEYDTDNIKEYKCTLGKCSITA